MVDCLFTPQGDTPRRTPCERESCVSQLPQCQALILCNCYMVQTSAPMRLQALEELNETIQGTGILSCACIWSAQICRMCKILHDIGRVCLS